MATLPPPSRQKVVRRALLQKRKDERRHQTQMDDLNELNFVAIAIDIHAGAPLAEEERRRHFNQDIEHAEARRQTQQRGRQTSYMELKDLETTWSIQNSGNHCTA